MKKIEEIHNFIDAVDSKPKKRGISIKKRTSTSLIVVCLIAMVLTVSAGLITSFLTVDVTITATESLYFENIGSKSFNGFQGGDTITDWINITNVNDGVNYILNIQNTTTPGLTVTYENPVTVNANSWTNVTITWALNPYIDTEQPITGTIEVLPDDYTVI